MPPADVQSVITAVARVVADAHPLPEVVSALASHLRPAIPFDRMHLLRLDRADTVTLLTARASGEVDAAVHKLADAAALAQSGESTGGHPLGPNAPSVMMCPLRHGPRVLGALWFTADAPDRFEAGHHAIIEELSDLVGMAVLYEALRASDALRRDRLDSLERLLQTVAGVLDIRGAFAEISAVLQEALPHDVLALTAWAGDSRSFRLHALAGADVDDMWWQPIMLDESDQSLLNRSAYVVRDVDAEIPAASIRGRMFRAVDAQSVLRVALPLDNDVFGSLFFLSRDPDHFSDEDLDFARRAASYLALALSHQKLSEASRRDAEARETASRLEAQVATLKRELESRGGQRRVVGSSPRWKNVLAQAARVAPTDTTVLLTGESGTGKEIVARFVHHASRRAGGPFVAINCAALPDQLLESELFGHERGAFTGAVAAKPGRIEQASGGLLFLDEIGEMSISVQAKLLRVLEEREFLRLGGTCTLRADIRVVAATNRDLMEAIARGTFREDLYYRLGVFEIHLPPLRERPEDIMELAVDFLKELGQTVGKPPAGISVEARDQLLAYRWPGNVRELRNAIERAVILADGAVIRPEHLPFASARPATVDAAAGIALPAAGLDLEDVERTLVLKALAQARHNKSRAARLLGLTRSQLYSRIEKYGLQERES
jgi:transcriptional regulator with GAF, ATPase, and Fis domain